MTLRRCLTALLFFATGMGGAVSSRLVKAGRISPAWLFVNSGATCAVWWLQLSGRGSVVQDSLLFDFLYGGAYLAVMVAAGEAARWPQIIGLLLGFAGVLVAAL